MPRELNFSRFVSKIRDILLGAGETGIEKNTLSQLVRTKKFSIEDLNLVLEEWNRAGLIDYYQARANNVKKSQIVRATDQLIHKWDQVFENTDDDELIELRDRLG